MFKLFDSHCHLQFPQYDADRAEVLARMREKEMGAVVVGTDIETSRAGLELARQHDFLWASVGLHPNDNLEEVFDEAGFMELAADPKVVAIGECGLDYFRLGEAPTPEGGRGPDQSVGKKAAQKERFIKHLALAETVKKPLIIHCRPSVAKAVEGKNAHDDMLEILTAKKPNIPVIIHFFTGTAELAQKYLDLGCYLSYPGPVTYTDHRSLRGPAKGDGMYDEAIRITPLDKMLIETDAPFAAPVPNRGKRNEPAYVEHVAAKIAAIKGISAEEVALASAENAQTVFTDFQPTR